MIYIKNGDKDEKIRNNKIADAMEISVSKVEDLKEIWNRYTISMIQFDEDKNEFDITDQKQADEFKNGNFPSPENIYLWNEKINSILSIVKAELKEHYGDSSEDSLLFKKILTVDLLRKHFPQKKADKKDGKDKKAEARKKIEEESSYYFNLEKLFRDAGFFDPKILESLFSDENYCLPEMQSLAEGLKKRPTKSGLLKSGLSKKLTRFYEKVVERYEDTYFPKEDYDAEKDSVIKDSVMRGVRKFLGLKSDNYSENRQDASLCRENELSK